MREKCCESSECGQPLCLHLFLTEPQSVHTGRNPVSVRNGPKPFTSELVSGTIRELILGKDLLNVTPGENLKEEASYSKELYQREITVHML